MRRILYTAIMFSLIMVVMISGCTDSTQSSGQNNYQPTVVQTPPSMPVATTSIVETPVNVESTISPESTPQEIYVPSHIPQYSAGDIVKDTVRGKLLLITKVDEDLGKYCIKDIFTSNGKSYLKKDYTFHEFGDADFFREIDTITYQYEDTADSLVIYDKSGDIFGYLEYRNPITMEFVYPSANKLEGDLNFVLDVWYDGKIDIHYTIGKSGSSHEYSMNNFKSYDLPDGDSAFVHIYKEDRNANLLKAVLKADGVVVAEGETDSEWGSVHLSYL